MELLLTRTQRVKLNKSKSAMRRALLKSYLQIAPKDRDAVILIDEYVARARDQRRGVRKFVDHIVADLLKFSRIGDSLELRLNNAGFKFLVSMAGDGSLQAYVWGDQAHWHEEAYFILAIQLTAEHLNFEGRDLTRILPPGLREKYQ